MRRRDRDDHARLAERNLADAVLGGGRLEPVRGDRGLEDRAIRSVAISPYASYSSRSTSRVVPQKTTSAPAPGRPTAATRSLTESGSPVTRACTAPPLTGGISASSSPAATRR